MKALFALTMMALVTSACHVDLNTYVKIAGGNPPSFVLSGIGPLGRVTIYGPGYRGDLLDKSHMIWAIEAEGSDGKTFKEVGPITYGVTPQGFKQLIPEGKLAPVPLSQRDRYRYYVYSLRARPAQGYFEIYDDKAEIVERATLARPPAIDVHAHLRVASVD